MWDSPYVILSSLLIGAAINIERLDGDSDSVDFVFDSDEKHEPLSRIMLPSLMNMRSGFGSIVNMVHRDEKQFLPLQAADLLAWQIRRFFSVREPRRKHFDLAMRCVPEEPHSFVMDRAKVRQIMNDINESAAKLAPKLGRSPDVRTWGQNESRSGKKLH